MNKFKKTRVKTKLTVAVLFALSSASANAEMFELGNGNNNFTMLTSSGAGTGGTNDVVAMWDGTFNTDVATAVTNMTLTSVTPFFGVNWFAHDVQVYGPGSYMFEACPGPIDDSGKAADGSIGCAGGSALQTMTVGEGQAGVHMLFDWNGTVNIDVINVWDMEAVFGFGGGSLYTDDTACNTNRKKGDPDAMACDRFLRNEWQFTATDPDGNGVPGTGMIDGPFQGFNASFNIRPEVVPVPAAVWLMGSGLLGLVGVARRKKR